ncbi:helix-turn-helix domain-containing protein [Citreimonas salinaria]|uniref:Replication protein C C-terminal region n=1 Tax=Citreimonas salinaria TaxID=321339 RepID=A0A1H3N6T2_9RHOB|nr:helix-turn-helix domain-containing protein [Citreimonas salinaria]SDY84582.1 Replication protein C C-terminal region [Citreimonas salinaria]
MTQTIDAILKSLGQPPSGPETCPEPRPGRAGGAAAENPVFRGLDRWQVLDLVAACRPRLKLSDAALDALRAHLSLLPRGPLDSSQLLMSFASIETVMDRSSMQCERRWRRAEVELERAGLITRKLSPNRRRFPIRDHRGKPTDGFGINLRPLFERVPELHQMRSDIKAQAAEVAALKTSIRARLHALKERFGDGVEWLLTFYESVTRLLRRKTVTRVELASVLNDIERLDQPDWARVKSPETGVSRSGQEHPEAGTMSAADGQTVRHIESEINYSKNAPSRTTTGQILARCASLKDLVPVKQYRGIEDVAHSVARALSMREGTILSAMKRMGVVATLQALDYLASRESQVRCPDAYLATLAQHPFPRFRQRRETFHVHRGEPLTSAKSWTRQ